MDGRLTITELAERVRLTVSPCHRRLRELEHGRDSGTGRSSIPPRSGSASSSCPRDDGPRRRRDYRGNRRNRLGGGEKECDTQRGSSGTRTTSCASPPPTLPPTRFSRDEKLATLPGVQRLTSTIVMKRVVDDRPFPTAARLIVATKPEPSPRPAPPTSTTPQDFGGRTTRDLVFVNRYLDLLPLILLVPVAPVVTRFAFGRGWRQGCGSLANRGASQCGG